ncbi:hypothetical protein jhhlp_000589 [Lomentospora prolificans]|uniref:F-box domain-containing protein n=1 Tax=Lomentospora prolificans TaxID=41688 RepID=A0A2N3NIX8_9PEZI|nr:hypothetical protein jhhlp_000589 [Lomentospora prolificans]
MPTKRSAGSDPDALAATTAVKRRKIENESLHGNSHHALPCSFAASSHDHISSLSDEILLRILSFLPLSTLLGISPVSRRFRRLSTDSQLWRQLYYLHFVLPRAMRIPGFRPNLCQDGTASSRTVLRHSGVDLRKSRALSGDTFIDWKRQYKLRHNWSRGKCAVEELDVGADGLDPGLRRKRTLAKVLDGIAITADSTAGLRAWDLKSKKLLAQADLSDGHISSDPTCIAVDDQSADGKGLGVALGFFDGSFGVWSLDLVAGEMSKRYRHSNSTNGKLISVAYHFPYVMTATSRDLVSIYAFDMPTKGGTTFENEIHRNPLTLTEMLAASARESVGQKNGLGQPGEHEKDQDSTTLAPPYLMTSLKSHSSMDPLALSIRKTSSSTIASIAYTLPTREGWTIGIQELHIQTIRTRLETFSEIVDSRVAHAPPIITGRSARIPRGNTASEAIGSAGDEESDSSDINTETHGPMSLCYTHPYLLATQPDNTLILYLCTTNATDVSISRGIRLWGHTSGIGDAEITSRGKAVSVSCRGDELRVWELEGRTSGRSVEIRPNLTGAAQDAPSLSPRDEWDDRRSWVGFDDEMVIVLKKAKTGRETLMMYDFS